MNDHKKGKSAVIITAPILYAILGIGLLVFPEAVLEYLCPVLAVAAAVFGVIDIYSYLMHPATENFQSNGFAAGVILLVLAVTIFVQKEWFMEQVIVLLGFLITLNGVRELQNWVDIVRPKVNNAWITAFVAALNLVLGVMVITNIPLITNVRLTVAAIGLLFSGLADHIATVIAYAKGRTSAGKETPLEPAVREEPDKPSSSLEKPKEKDNHDDV